MQRRKVKGQKVRKVWSSTGSQNTTTPVEHLQVEHPFLEFLFKNNAKCICKIWAQYLPASGQKCNFEPCEEHQVFTVVSWDILLCICLCSSIKKLPEILTFQISLSIFPTAKSLHGCFCTIIHTQSGRTRLRGQGWEGGERQDRVVRPLGKHVCVCVFSMCTVHGCSVFGCDLIRCSMDVDIWLYVARIKG